MTESDFHTLIPCPAILTDSQGVILFTNSAFCKLIDDQNFEGRNIDEVFTLASRMFLQTHLWPMLTKEKRINEIFIKLCGMDKHPIATMVNCNAIVQDNTTHYCWAFFPASERQKFEAEIIHTRNQLQSTNKSLNTTQEALLQANQTIAQSHQKLERFVYTISHDIKAPLLTMRSFSSYLVNELSTTLTTKQQHRLERIQHNAEHLTEMVDVLLDEAITEQLEKNVSQIDLQWLIQEQIQLLEGPLGDVGAKVNVIGDFTVIQGNKIQLSQCIQNLIGNAIRYRHKERKLVIDIEGQLLDKQCVILIKDNGIGIEREHLSRIFTLFHHVDEKKGTGAGLAIVKNVIEKHHGSISCDSEYNVFTAFSLSFPLMKKLI